MPRCIEVWSVKVRRSHLSCLRPQRRTKINPRAVERHAVQVGIIATELEGNSLVAIESRRPHQGLSELHHVVISRQLLLNKTKGGFQPFISETYSLFPYARSLRS